MVKDRPRASPLGQEIYGQSDSASLLLLLGVGSWFYMQCIGDVIGMGRDEPL